jgi:hypothetical protein
MSKQTSSSVNWQDPVSVLDSAIDAAEDRVKNEWQHRARSATEHLEAAKRLRELAEIEIRCAEAEILSAEETAKRAVDGLITVFRPEKILPAWEAKGDLMPPNVRLLLQELRNTPGALPSPVLSSAEERDQLQQREKSQVADNTIEPEVTVRGSELPKNATSSVQCLSSRRYH